MDKEELLSSLKNNGFHERILGAFARVKREDFVHENFKKLAYEDIALPLSNEQTISQPSTIALALTLLKLKENQKVLEVGSGCGYVLALMSEIVGETGKVYGVEIVKELYDKSIENLKPYNNVTVYNRNGKIHAEEAPFNRILISAALSEIPHEVLDQLADNGIIVAPIGSGFMQTLTSIRKTDTKFTVEKEIPGFIFVHFVD
ncbi:MAG: protein-L-isoaspartate O-methyltransferase [Candidatus Pacearchaeota archaeon]|nr:protein-L-isoaspartate O-methyltransferase [Candidatus Pacearchaeota archaeon]